MRLTNFCLLRYSFQQSFHSMCLLQRMPSSITYLSQQIINNKSWVVPADFLPFSSRGTESQTAASSGAVTTTVHAAQEQIVIRVTAASVTCKSSSLRRIFKCFCQAATCRGHRSTAIQRKSGEAVKRGRTFT